MIENREVMAKNIRNNMEKMGVNATEVCRALDIKQNTFSDWINAKTYPRIDKIEKMAQYFGISKSELVEEQSSIYYDATLVERAMKYYKKIDSLPPDKRAALDQYLSFLQSDSAPNN